MARGWLRSWLQRRFPAPPLQAPRVWDCCAAPGGKTLMLALRLPAAEILATDVSSKRLANTAARLRRFSYAKHVRCEVADASAAANEDSEAAFDLILCDVPCTGTGTLARNPEIRHRLRPEELARQAARQREILAHAASRLAPGGRIVYSTCSLEPEENEAVVNAVLSSGELRPIRIEPMLEGLVSAGILSAASGSSLLSSGISDGALRTLPGMHPCDGFFATVLERPVG